MREIFRRPDTGLKGKIYYMKNDQIEGILSRHEITDPVERALIRVASEAAAASLEPPSAIVARAELKHPSDRALALATTEAIRTAQRKGRLIITACISIAIPLAVIIAFMVFAKTSSDRAFSQHVKQLQDDQTALQGQIRDLSRSYQDASAKATEEALSSQKYVADNSKALALNFADATKSQADEIVALKTENQRLKDELTKAQQASKP